MRSRLYEALENGTGTNKIDLKSLNVRFIFVAGFVYISNVFGVCIWVNEARNTHETKTNIKCEVVDDNGLYHKNGYMVLYANERCKRQKKKTSRQSKTAKSFTVCKRFFTYTATNTTPDNVRSKVVEDTNQITSCANQKMISTQRKRERDKTESGSSKRKLKEREKTGCLSVYAGIYLLILVFWIIMWPPTRKRL